MEMREAASMAGLSMPDTIGPTIKVPQEPPQQKVYSIKFVDESGQRVEIHVRNDHWVEAMLRALIHSGYEVIVKEFWK